MGDGPRSRMMANHVTIARIMKERLAPGKKAWSGEKGPWTWFQTLDLDSESESDSDRFTNVIFLIYLEFRAHIMADLACVCNYEDCDCESLLKFITDPDIPNGICAWSVIHSLRNLALVFQKARADSYEIALVDDDRFIRRAIRDMTISLNIFTRPGAEEFVCCEGCIPPGSTDRVGGNDCRAMHYVSTRLTWYWDSKIEGVILGWFNTNTASARDRIIDSNPQQHLMNVNLNHDHRTMERNGKCILLIMGAIPVPFAAMFVKQYYNFVGDKIVEFYFKGEERLEATFLNMLYFMCMSAQEVVTGPQRGFFELAKLEIDNLMLDLDISSDMAVCAHIRHPRLLAEAQRTLGTIWQAASVISEKRFAIVMFQVRQAMQAFVKIAVDSMKPLPKTQPPPPSSAAVALIDKKVKKTKQNRKKKKKKKQRKAKRMKSCFRPTCPVKLNRALKDRWIRICSLCSFAAFIAPALADPCPSCDECSWGSKIKA